MNKYPYYIIPDIRALREGKNLRPEQVMMHKRRIAANVGDLCSLRIILGEDPEEFLEFYPDNKKKDLSTFDTIDTFLTTFGSKPESPAAPLENKETEEPVRDEPEKQEEPKKEQKIDETEDKEVAKLVKKGRYREALQIINAMRLNNPEKSAYFADQIRFLKKLILNEAYSKNREKA